MINKDFLVELESTLVCQIRPHFLKVEKNEDFTHIIICHPRYTNLSISERIGSVFNLLKIYNNDILIKEPVVIEVFSPNEMNDLFEHWL